MNPFADVQPKRGFVQTPTYGHSAGHTSLFLQMGDYPLCLAVDALYRVRYLNPRFAGSESIRLAEEGAALTARAAV
jgi:hypothetical protein